MSSLLIAVAYLSPLLILVGGIVMAITRRHLIGTRASNRLAAGAGLLLLSWAFIPFRPLLRHAIDKMARSSSGQFASVAELVTGFALLQAVLLATGTRLIIAAAIGRRPQTVLAEPNPPSHEA
jgi:hypothetical protein